MPYINTIHPQVRDVAAYSSLGCAVTPEDLSRFWKKNLPGGYAHDSKWIATVGSPGKYRPVYFNIIGSHGRGIPVSELLSRGYYGMSASMDGAYDKVLAHTGLQRITFRLVWPGYENVNWTRSIQIYNENGPITRAGLAVEIAKIISCFVMNSAYEPCANQDWQLHPAKITIKRVVLVALHHISEGSWQAEVLVDV
ncbi:hypothetical protein PC9H_004490 [Pleurotus ostreatus]|uniref:Uncharacterized protein n=1 Tax=Pleurotus ostreatus TaxID=5322 RepID=A0A8H7DTJ3_PLEOS|nr:uncharacterized protein PC9H_004490 [Pleurotus ostreatus]KAF7432549.1 hypothetical protein PC9H_004490 [Pleurotus ostreatus]